MKYIDTKLGLEVELIKHPDTGIYINLEWRDVVGYEGYYQVSNYGQVKSLDRYVEYRNRGSRIHKGKLLKPQYGNCRYMQVGLRKNKVNTRKLVHRLVAEAFIDNPQVKSCVNHLNSERTYNNVINLEWTTHRENTRHSINAGIFNSAGEASNSAKLTNESVYKIVNLIDSGDMTFIEIANMFGVSKSVIGKINTGDTWNHITGRKGLITPSDLKGSNNPRSRSVINCRGEIFTTAKEATKKYNMRSQSGICQACRGITKSAGQYEDGTPIKWTYYKDSK